MNIMLDTLRTTAAGNPDKTAFYDDDESLTFSQLLELSERIGTYIAARALLFTPVALIMDARSIRNIPAMYGAIAAGCPYAPLDAALPPERLALLLTLLSPAMILCDEKGQRALEKCGNPAHCLYRDAAEWEPDRKLLTERAEKMSRDTPMSILYTSGSTGIPKGSVQTQGSYQAWTDATIRRYGLDEKTVFGNQSPFFYANSILDIFPPVSLGAKVYLLPSGVLTFPARLISCLQTHHITELCMTPSSFVKISGALTDGCLPELKWGIMSGESMPIPPLKTWMAATPNASWWHFYGSTEMFSVAVGKVEVIREEERLPVGRLFPDVSVLFLDENGAPAKPGEPGEMLVSSPWVAKEYCHDVRRTADSFVSMDGRRYFACGDLGYLRADGQLMVLGRRDTQIKHMGYRMDLGDVQAALDKIIGVQESCVLFDRERDKIWCFYAGNCAEKDVRAQLKSTLPKYMQPDRVMWLSALPHTQTMKIDRMQLSSLMNQ